MRKLTYVLLIIVLLFNPLGSGIAQAMLLANADHGVAPQCSNQPAHASFHRETGDVRHPATPAGTELSSATLGLSQAVSQTACQESPCVHCVACCHGFSANISLWPTDMPPILSSSVILYHITTYQIDLKPALHPPRLS